MNPDPETHSWSLECCLLVSHFSLLFVGVFAVRWASLRFDNGVLRRVVIRELGQVRLGQDWLRAGQVSSDGDPRIIHRHLGLVGVLIFRGHGVVDRHRQHQHTEGAAEEEAEGKEETEEKEESDTRTPKRDTYSRVYSR